MSKKREYNLRLWKGLIQEQQASGMTITAWCKQNGYTKDKYYYWLEQVRNETFDTEVRNLPVPSEQERSAGTAVCSPAMMTDLSKECTFVELSAPAPVTTTEDTDVAAACPAAVIRKDGMQIEIFRDTKEDFLRLLLTVLKDA